VPGGLKDHTAATPGAQRRRLQVLSGAELHVAGACSSMADRRIQVRTEKAIRELVEVECSFFYFLFLFATCAFPFKFFNSALTLLEKAKLNYKAWDPEHHKRKLLSTATFHL